MSTCDKKFPTSKKDEDSYSINNTSLRVATKSSSSMKFIGKKFKFLINIDLKKIV